MKQKATSRRSELQKTLRKAEAEFERTFFLKDRKTLFYLGERSLELRKSLHQMWMSLGKVPDGSLSVTRYRKIRRQLRRVVCFAEKYRELDVDMRILESGLLDLETEFAAIKSLGDMLEGIIEWS
ncbi:hypothetical protein [Bradyrhizobium sp. McL0616]|uniref:hypothetical protein n=1 Tax=Bradyrhizobium sp. McL0616 TaxID=3415674 RepID=UPI003CEF0C29